MGFRSFYSHVEIHLQEDNAQANRCTYIMLETGKDVAIKGPLCMYTKGIEQVYIVIFCPMG